MASFIKPVSGLPPTATLRAVLFKHALHFSQKSPLTHLTIIRVFLLHLSSTWMCSCVRSLGLYHTCTHTRARAQREQISTHLLLISDDMSDAKWEIWISFLRRQSLIHWQKAQMWEDDFSDLDPSGSALSGTHVILRTREAGGVRVVSHVWMDRGDIWTTGGGLECSNYCVHE